MSAFIDEVAVILGGKPALSEMDREIIETMIEIGAAPEEIAETFGYAPAQVEAVGEAPELFLGERRTAPAITLSGLGLPGRAGRELP